MYEDFAFTLYEPDWNFDKDEMSLVGLSGVIKNLAREKDMNLSEEVILQWLQKRQKEKAKKKKSSQKISKGFEQ